MTEDFRCVFDLRVYLCLHCIEINTSEECVCARARVCADKGRWGYCVQRIYL